jgi:hypothetical protein
LRTTTEDRRLHARAPLVVAARFDLGREARVLDLSIGGARLEHRDPLRRGATCRLRFALNDQVYLFNADVVWSQAVQPQNGGDSGLFHSGVAFERIPDEPRALLVQLAAA